MIAPSPLTTGQVLLHLTIPGRPVPAVRMTQKGKYRSPQAQRYLAYKNRVGWRAREHYKDEPYTEPVSVTIYYYAPANRPADLDNIVKSICDGLNKVIWADDKQVCSILIEQVITTEEHERVNIIVTTWTCPVELVLGGPDD